MVECLCSVHSKFAILALVQDRLGWDLFVEGRISKLWLETMTPFFAQSGIKSASKWGVRFVGCLISITHKQWIFQNSKVHHKSEGLTQKQHDELFANVRELMWTEPLTLLPKHLSLLTKNVGLLGEGPTKMRRGWVVSMESVLKAATRVRVGTAVSPEAAMLACNRPSHPLTSSETCTMDYTDSHCTISATSSLSFRTACMTSSHSGGTVNKQSGQQENADTPARPW